jgi:hypothetical protein
MESENILVTVTARARRVLYQLSSAVSSWNIQNAALHNSATYKRSSAAMLPHCL